MDVFDIVILGFDRSRPDSPAAGLQRVFPIDQGAAVRLINALPATVKRGVPESAAEQYRAALTAIGARVELKKVEPKAPAPLPPTAPTPVVPTAAPAVLASSRFTGAATLKQGSPLDSVIPGPPTTAPAAPTSSNNLASAAVTVVPEIAPSSDRPSAAITQPAASTPPLASSPLAPLESWGALQAAPLAAAASSAAPEVDTAPPGPREENRRELFRRLMDPRQTGPAEFSPADSGGISALELDLPPPRAGWAAANHETVGADEVSAPVISGALSSASDAASPAAASERKPPIVLSVRPPITAPPAVTQVFEPPPDNRSFSEALPDAIALSLREGGALWLAYAGGIGALTSGLMIALRGQPTLRGLLSIGAVLLLLALVCEQAIWTLRAVVDDLDSPDAPDLRGSDMGRYFVAAFHLLAVGVLLQLPFLLWLGRHRDALPGALTSEPAGLLLMLLGTLYWPMAVGMQAISENPSAAWSLPRGARVILAAPFEYVTLLLSAAIMALLPIGLTLFMTRGGLPSELMWLGVSIGLSLSHGTTAALIGHVARLHPRAFEDD